MAASTRSSRMSRWRNWDSTICARAVAKYSGGMPSLAWLMDSQCSECLATRACYQGNQPLPRFAWDLSAGYNGGQWPAAAATESEEASCGMGNVMAARSDFWLVVHQLATCLEAEGHTRADRTESIVDALMAMPRAARIQLKRELSLILDDLVPLPPEITRRESTKSDSGFFN